MSSFLYFVPGRPSAEKIKELIPHLGEFNRGENTNGVEGCGSGYILSDVDDSPRLELDKQTWQKSGCGQFYVGYWTDNKPTPADLAKPSLIDGPTTNGWQIPKVRSWLLHDDKQTYIDRLPRKPMWDGVQFQPGAVVDRCRPIVDLTQRAFDLLTKMHSQSDGQNLTMPDETPLIACEIVSINYRIGPDEFAMLPVCDYSFEHLVGILMTFTGFDDLLALHEATEKKTA